MSKINLLIIALVSAFIMGAGKVDAHVSGSPNVTQIHYSLRDDDGSETAATFLNSDLSSVDSDSSTAVTAGTAFRIRFELSNEGTANPSGSEYTLQYAAKGASANCTSVPSGNFSNVPVNATTEPVEMVTTSDYSDQTTSSNCTSTSSCNLPDEGSTFVAGDLVEDPSNSSTVKKGIKTGFFSEMEYAVALTSDIVDSETYCFRLDPVDTYSVVPGVIAGASAGGYETSGDYVSSDFDVGSSTVFNAIEWDWSKTDVGCISCTVSFQIKTADDSGGSPGTWSPTWCGPDGEDGDETDFFSISTGGLIHADHNGDQWIKYKAIFAGDGVDTAILEEVRVNYRQ